MQTLLKDKKLIISFGAILFLALVLRLVNLNELPIFADEAIYVRWAQVMRAESTLRFLPLSDGKQPLFMWLTIPFLKLITNPLIAARLLSIFSGIGTITGVFALSYLLFSSKKVSLFASLIYAFIPFSFFFDRMALVDSLLGFFVIWTTFFVLLTIKTRRLDLAMISGFFLGGAFLTKSPAIFVAVLLPLLLILDYKDNFKVKGLFKLLMLLFVVYLIGFGIQNILRLGPNFELIASRNLDYVYPVTHFFSSPLDPTIPHIKDTLIWFVYLLPLTTLLLLPFIDLKNSFRKLFVLFLYFAFPIFVESALAKVYTARYILFTIPFLVIFLSSAFLTASEKLSKIIYVATALILLTSIFQNFLLLSNPQKAFLPTGERSGYLEDWTAGYGIPEVASYIRSEYQKDPSKKIVVGTEGYFGTLPDGLQIYLNDLREVVVIGVGLGINKIPTSLSESNLAGNKTYLVVNSTRLDASYEKLGLVKIASYPKAEKSNGSREELLFFEIK